MAMKVSTSSNDTKHDLYVPFLYTERMAAYTLAILSSLLAPKGKGKQSIFIPIEVIILSCPLQPKLFQILLVCSDTYACVFLYTITIIVIHKKIHIIRKIMPKKIFILFFSGRSIAPGRRNFSACVGVSIHCFLWGIHEQCAGLVCCCGELLYADARPQYGCSLLFWSILGFWNEVPTLW